MRCWLEWLHSSPTMDAGPGRGLARKQARTRTTVACRRCKSRKQKCDGKTPCSNCANSCYDGCAYDLSPTLTRSHEQYARARRRVSDLERVLSRLGEVNEAGETNVGSLGSASSSESNENGIDIVAPPSLPAVPSSPQQRRPSTIAVEGQRPQQFDDVLRHLSLQATGGYVDPSSTVTLGGMLHAVATSKSNDDHVATPCFLKQNLTPKSLYLLAQSADRSIISLSGIPDVIANRMLEKGYFNYIATLWPLMQPKVLTSLHQRRATLDDRFEIAALHLIYAAAGRFLETTGETGSFRSERHYQAATNLLPEILTGHGSIQVVQILLLLAIYSLRAPRGPGAWTFVGMAMRMCIELGLHRKTKNPLALKAEDEELRRRVFWSCYCLDRQVSIILGRPLAVSDRDIDQSLPSTADEQYSRDSTECFVHICRLRTIESQIQQAVYRVDQPLHTNTMWVEVQSFLDQLQTWRSEIPSYHENSSSSSTNNYDSYVSDCLSCIDGQQLIIGQLIYYHQAVRFLMHPFITSACPTDDYMSTAVDACGGKLCHLPT